MPCRALLSRAIALALPAALPVAAMTAEVLPGPSPSPAPASGLVADGAETGPGTAPLVRPTATNRPVEPGSKPGRRLAIAAEASAGYDSNVLLESSQSPRASDKDSIALGAGLKLTGRVYDGGDTRLDVGADVDISDYPSNREAQLFRFGGRVFGQTSVDAGGLGRIDPGLLIGVHRFLLDGRGTATSANATALAIKATAHWVGVATVGATRISYDDLDESSGTLIDGAYRHLFLLEASNIRRMIEVSLRGGLYAAESDTESYATIIPAVGGAWRFGARQPALGTVDVSGRVLVELRGYDEGRPGASSEGQTILRFNAGADYWLCREASLGLYLGLSRRDSTLEDSDYDRFQAGIRLATTW